MKYWLSLFLCLTLAACGQQEASAPEQSPEQESTDVTVEHSKVLKQHTAAAEQAIDREDWNEAIQHWNKALKEANRIELAEDLMAAIYYERGRAAGIQCNWDLAKADLQQAYDLDKASDGPVFMSLLELARLHMAQEKFEQSKAYFDQLFPLLEAEQAVAVDPVGSIQILRDYAEVLEVLGANNAAKVYQEKADELWEHNKQYAPATLKTPYGSQCKTSA